MIQIMYNCYFIYIFILYILLLYLMPMNICVKFCDLIVIKTISMTYEEVKAMQSSSHKKEGTDLLLIE